MGVPSRPIWSIIVTLTPRDIIMDVSELISIWTKNTIPFELRPVSNFNVYMLNPFFFKLRWLQTEYKHMEFYFCFIFLGSELSGNWTIIFVAVMISLIECNFLSFKVAYSLASSYSSTASMPQERDPCSGSLLTAGTAPQNSLEEAHQGAIMVAWVDQIFMLV